MKDNGKGDKLKTKDLDINDASDMLIAVCLLKEMLSYPYAPYDGVAKTIMKIVGSCR